eukprot:836933-Prymnesium_polylepis.1
MHAELLAQPHEVDEQCRLRHAEVGPALAQARAVLRIRERVADVPHHLEHAEHVAVQVLELLRAVRAHDLERIGHRNVVVVVQLARHHQRRQAFDDGVAFAWSLLLEERRVERRLRLLYGGLELLLESVVVLLDVRHVEQHPKPVHDRGHLDQQPLAVERHRQRALAARCQKTLSAETLSLLLGPACKKASLAGLNLKFLRKTHLSR